jgi:hypothetical protein
MNKIVRLESLTLFAICVFAFFALNESWRLFALYFIAIDLSMVGYLINNKVGAIVYNLGHTFVFPALLILFAIATESAGNQNHDLVVFAFVWLAHISLDRTLGFGLKLHDFHHTHLGVIGKPKN